MIELFLVVAFGLVEQGSPPYKIRKPIYLSIGGVREAHNSKDAGDIR